MADQEIILAVFLRQAARQAALPGSTKTAIEILTDIQAGHFTTVSQNGTTIIQTSDAGGSVQFAVIAGLGPLEIVHYAELALQRLEGVRKVSKIRPSFVRASIR